MNSLAGGADLGATHLRFAVNDLLHEHRADGCRTGLADMQARLWREDPERVRAAYDVAWLGDLDGPRELGGRHGLRAHAMRQLRRPLPWRDRRGLTIAEVAEQAGLDREVLARCLVQHGYLHLVNYGGTQRRRLVTDAAFEAEVGHNADGARRHVGRVEGRGKAVPFPVFYPEAIAGILWTLDLEGIASGAAAQPTKRKRLVWLLEEHGYLPDAEIARLAGCLERAMRRARQKTGGSGIDPVSWTP